MKGFRLAPHHEHRILVIRPGFVRVDGYIDPEFGAGERMLQKGCRADAVLRGAPRRDDFEARGVGRGPAHGQCDLSAREGESVDCRSPGLTT